MKNMKLRIKRLKIYWFLLITVPKKGESDEFNPCGEQPISGKLCWRMFPSRVLNPQDAQRPVPIQNTSCAFIQHDDSLTITGSTADMNAPPINSCDFIPSNTSNYNFGATTSKITIMSVQNTNITSLTKGIFSTWGGVKILEINMNYKLERIEPRTFENLLNVWNLTISDNPVLEVLEENTFAGLINLQELRYLRNGLKKISQISIALGPSVLPNVTVLFLTGNCIPKIYNDDFIPMKNSKLNTLEISLTKTNFIHEEAFDPLGPLEDLTLSRNNLGSAVLTPLINHVVKRYYSLQYLQIDQNVLGIEINPLLKTIAQNGSAISYLNLKNNHFGILQPGFFPKMETLEALDLTNVMIDDLQEGVISKELMPNLDKLYLGRNLFSGLAPYMVPETLKRLDLSYNENDLPWTTVFHIDPAVFIKMPKLQLLNLSGNKLYVLQRQTLREARELEVLFLKQSFINEIQEGAFSNNNKMFYLDLSSNNFPIVNPFKKEIFIGLDNLIALDLSDCHISYLQHDDVFFYLKKLQYLSLRMNAIFQLSSKTFQNMPYLYTIDLRYNILVAWNHRIFQNNKLLNNTLLDYNHIQTITDAMLDDFMMSKVVHLYSNSIVCDCTLMKTVARVIKSGGIEDVKKLPFSDEMSICVNQNGETLANYLSIVNSAQCINKEWITVISATLITIILTSFIAYVVYYYYKYDIHFWFLRTKRRLGLLHYIGSKNRENPGDFKYDAFVSYCNEDKKFVEKMVYILEKDCSKFNLCVYERDFKVGDVLTDKIVQCMESSRKTILVLTEAFAKSQWCCWEMYIAQSRSISLRNSDPCNSLILIKKSDIPEALMTPTLKYLMKTRVYLEWHDSPIRQKIFWEQLKSSLRTRK